VSYSAVQRADLNVYPAKEQVKRFRLFPRSATNQKLGAAFRLSPLDGIRYTPFLGLREGEYHVRDDNCDK
jgi:hypothetical protein